MSRCPKIQSNTSKNYNLVSQKWLLAAETNTLSNHTYLVRVSRTVWVPYVCPMTFDFDRQFVKFAAVLPERRTPRWTCSSLAEEVDLALSSFSIGLYQLVSSVVKMDFVTHFLTSKLEVGSPFEFVVVLFTHHLGYSLSFLVIVSPLVDASLFNTFICIPFGGYGCFPRPLLNSFASHWVEWIYNTA